MKKILLLVFLVMLVFCGGCNILGWILAPGPYDRKYTPEYKIKDHAKDKVMVVIDRDAGGEFGIKMRSQLRDAIGTLLVARAGVNKKYLEVRSEIDTLKQTNGASLNYSPAQLGAEAGVGLVLYTHVLNYKLYPSGPQGFFIGSLDTATVIIDVEKKKVVWPADGNAKIVRMQVGIENEGKDDTVEKLMTSTAHGIVRYLYPIRHRYFKTSMEKVSYSN
jgi:hypothetical protein